MRLHWSRDRVPNATYALEDATVNMLRNVAGCVPLADALSVWESAIRKGLVHPHVLARVDWGSEPARRLAAQASHLSDSGVETGFLLLMKSIGVSVRQQVWIDGHPVDGLIGERLVVQLDGFAHHQAKARRRDLRADARLTLLGYTVVRFDYQQVLFDPAYVTNIIALAVAQGRHH